VREHVDVVENAYPIATAFDPRWKGVWLKVEQRLLLSPLGESCFSETLQRIEETTFSAPSASSSIVVNLSSGNVPNITWLTVRLRNGEV
jgi:hypothetical protein